jgi:hypothetical protein
MNHADEIHEENTMTTGCAEFDEFIGHALEIGKHLVQENGHLASLVMTRGLGGRRTFGVVDNACHEDDQRLVIEIARLVKREEARMYLAMMQLPLRHSSAHHGIILQAYHKDGAKLSAMVPFFVTGDGIAFLDPHFADMPPYYAVGLLGNPFDRPQGHNKKGLCTWYPRSNPLHVARLPDSSQ